MKNEDKTQLFSKRLRILRKGKQLTQAQLGNLLNLENSTISSYERNKIMPSSDVLLKIAKYFNVSVDYLIGNTDEMHGQKEKSIDEIMQDVEVLFYNSGRDLNDDKKRMLSRIIKAALDDEDNKE
ncbi:helix-turn-helix transcriptional regulator [Veillonella sp.]|uniref:helix-turn-helix domain-containing protein n=1 Tax=Veillonella sp. TaxID=1926307 RepID=UPI0025E7819A|nr:helix-turn-helix transcriptional regulator [Veillonella sp.]